MSRDYGPSGSTYGHLFTDRVLLRPITPGDLPALRQLELSDHLAPTWRYAGATPSPAEHEHFTWAGQLAGFVVIDVASQDYLGICSCINPDHINRFAYLALCRFGGMERSPVYLQGALLFLNYVFQNWDFEKLYVETPGHALAQFSSSVGRLFVEEGVLRDHLYRVGGRVDLHILAIYRDQWLQYGRPLYEALIGTPHHGDGPVGKMAEV